MELLAHGIGGREDLPLPVWLFAYGAGAAVLISFVALALLWPTSRLEDEIEGRPLPGWIARLEPLLRVAGLAAFALTLWAAWAGHTNPNRNLAPTAVYVYFWVGVTMVSALVGDVWRALSPFDTIATLARRKGNTGPELGLWPAAALVFAFTWMELVHPEPASPRLLAWTITVYALAATTAGLVWGRDWLRRHEAFAAWFGLLARMAPFHKGDDGRLRLRPPLTGLVGVEARPGLVPLILVGLGSTSYDGLSRTRFWQEVLGDRTGWDAVPLSTVGIVWMVLLVGLAYSTSMRVAARDVDRDPAELQEWFAHTLVPIAFAYAVAHYFSLLVFQGQAGYSLISDPLGRGWDVFGTATATISYTAVTTTIIAWVQAAAIVLGHVSGVLMAHDRAVARFDKADAQRSQYPLLGAMVLYTVGGLALLLGA